MADSDQQMYTINSGISFNTTLQIAIAIVVFNFAIFTVIFIFYIRVKGYFRSVRSSRSRRLVFAPHELALPRHALDPSILSSLPVTIFRSEDFEEDGGLECAVCLCELTDGEEARLLPKCKHGFHVECIDMWFHSNSTCPLCRTPVSIESSVDIQIRIQVQPLQAISETGHSSNTPSTNLNEGSLRLAGPSSSSSSSSSSLGKERERMLVIDIPRRMMNGFSSSSSPLPLSRASPISPLPTSRSPASGRMRSLRKMLSRGSGKGAGPSCSPRGCDVDQGGLADSKCQ